MKWALEYRENIKLIHGNSNNSIMTEPFQKQIFDDGMVVRNTFSLMGTLADSTYLSSLPSFHQLSHHQGYASIAVVEETGCNCHFFKPQEIILMPVFLSKYFNIERFDLKENKKPLFFKIPNYIDQVEASFLPIICLAVYLLKDFDHDIDNKKVLCGCGLLGIILTQILNYKKNKVIICRNYHDLPSDYINEYGVEEIYDIDELHQLRLDNIGEVINLSRHDEFLYLHEKFKTQNITIINGVAYSSSPHDNKYFWMNYDIMHEAVYMLKNNIINVKQLIYQHFHIETVDEILNDIKCNKYNGLAIVYDW